MNTRDNFVNSLRDFTNLSRLFIGCSIDLLRVGVFGLIRQKKGKKCYGGRVPIHKEKHVPRSRG